MIQKSATDTFVSQFLRYLFIVSTFQTFMKYFSVISILHLLYKSVYMLHDAQKSHNGENLWFMFIFSDRICKPSGFLKTKSPMQWNRE